MLGYHVIHKKPGDFGYLERINKESKTMNQRDYDELGEVLTMYVQDQMVSKYGLIKVNMPHEGGPDRNIFMSQDFLEQVSKKQEPIKSQMMLQQKRVEQQAPEERRNALILIQGSGKVRPGLWSRSACINHSFELGSMLPLIDRAQKKNVSVIVLNPNFTNQEQRELRVSAKGSYDHSLYVWEKFIAPSKFNKFYIVAHSAGGGSLARIQEYYPEDFYIRVASVALTDSWTIDKHILRDQGTEKWMQDQRKFVHYVASNKPLGTDVGFGVCIEKSAGHNQHEYTTGTALPEIIRQFGWV
ncbi:hypothetical protein FGO68_gene17253 [Halteria grandinella]|uniref:Arb2 domain-containing protein n=1 Tax=Halteria grandinella TaxID=5974 RepID=A0A8J8NP44_HALGN|nr:hypothetical protein FGO68_gene17253 [Halteria grandinella]